MKKILFFICLSFVITACSTNYEDISIEEAHISSYSFQSTSKLILYIDVKVNNPTKKTLTVSDGSLEAYQQDRNFATLTVATPTVIAPQSNDYNRLVIDVNIKDFMALSGLNISDSSDLLEQFDVEGFLKVKAGIAGKKLKIARMNFKQLFQSLK